MRTTDAVLRALLDTAPDALVVVDPAGIVVYANTQVEHLFGWSRDDLVGLPVEVLVPEAFASGHPVLREGYVSHPATRPMGAGLNLWARRRDGSEFPAEISLSSFETEHGQLLAAAVRDVTLARQTEAKFRAVLEAAPDAIIGVNAQGQIVLVNAQAERLFAWTSGELVGRPVEVLVPQSLHDQHVAHRATYLEDPQVRPMGADLSLLGRRKDGSEFPAEISLSSVLDQDEKLVLAAVRDLTDRIEVENERRERSLATQREQAHRLESLGQLAGGVAHDFNNLLGVIMNYATLIGRAVEDAEVQSDLAEIRAAAERGATLTRHLLTFARRDVVEPEPVELNGIVTGVAAMLGLTLGASIQLNLRLEQAPMVVVADRHQVEHILVNLAINARDAMPEGGSVTISTWFALTVGTEAPGTVVLSVSDTGEGMSEQVAARALEPFFSTKDRAQGTGLGLATVYGIVRANGGDVSLESLIGQGTTVTIELPSSAREVAPSVAEQPHTRGGDERILLVEDEAALRLGTARVLREHGYSVIVAADGLEAIALLEQEGGILDLVLTDVVMPRMRGDELAAELDRRWAHVPVVFMSGYDFGGASLPGRRLPKPVQQDALLRTVREVLDDGPKRSPA